MRVLGVVQPVKAFVDKVLQLHECMKARHGNMLVGSSGSGKSTALQCLQMALTRMAVLQQGSTKQYTKVGTA